jgi:hypothetical protein
VSRSTWFSHAKHRHQIPSFVPASMSTTSALQHRYEQPAPLGDVHNRHKRQRLEPGLQNGLDTEDYEGIGEERDVRVDADPGGAGDCD